MVANDTQNGNVYGVPWFGGVRGIWYRKDQFAAAGIASTPTTWTELVSDAQKLMQKYPGTYGIGAPSNYTNAIVSFIWGAGGQVATETDGKWTANLTSPASEAGIKFYSDLLLSEKVSPSKYVGQTELGNPGATSGGSNEDFALGKLDMYIDGPWASAEFPANAADKSNWASFPIPSEGGPSPAPAFAGGSDLAVWSGSKYKSADWDLLQLMDSESNATSFANLQGFFPPVHVQADRRRLLEQPAHVRFRQGGHRHPDLPAQREELVDRRRDRRDHPDHDEGPRPRRELPVHGGTGQHPAAERPQHGAGKLTVAPC